MMPAPVPTPPRSWIWWSRIGRNAGVAAFLPFLIAAVVPRSTPYVFAVGGLSLFFLGRAAWREWRTGNPPARAMDRSEAARVLEAELGRLRLLSYAELEQSVNEPKRTTQVVRLSGARYYVDTLTAWDREEKGPVRVMVSVGSGRWDVLAPLTDSFIKTRDEER